MEIPLPENADTVLVRYGEIGIESSRVRRDMEDFLGRDVERAVERRGVEANVEGWLSRVLVEMEGYRRAAENATVEGSDGA